MLTQNREMRKDGIWNWTLPAWVVELSDGSSFNVCPNAGACKDQDRHADVFTSKEMMEELGYQDQSMSDLHAILLPTSRIGIPANNIRHFRKKQGSATFGQIEAGKIRHGRGKP